MQGQINSTNGFPNIENKTVDQLDMNTAAPSLKDILWDVLWDVLS